MSPSTIRGPSGKATARATGSRTANSANFTPDTPLVGVRRAILDDGGMHSRATLLGVTGALLAVAAARSAGLAASGADLAVLRVHVPPRVRLSDTHPTASA